MRKIIYRKQTISLEIRYIIYKENRYVTINLNIAVVLRKLAFY